MTIQSIRRNVELKALFKRFGFDDLHCDALVGILLSNSVALFQPPINYDRHNWRSVDDSYRADIVFQFDNTCSHLLFHHLHQGQCVNETLIHFGIAIFLSDTWSLMAIDESCLSVEVAWQSQTQEQTASELRPPVMKLSLAEAGVAHWEPGTETGIVLKGELMRLAVDVFALQRWRRSAVKSRKASAIGANEAISAPSYVESIVLDGGHFSSPRRVVP
jgi:hypothetical protein